eukprot:gene10260-8901_t
MMNRSKPTARTDPHTRILKTSKSSPPTSLYIYDQFVTGAMVLESQKPSSAVRRAASSASARSTRPRSPPGDAAAVLAAGKRVVSKNRKKSASRTLAKEKRKAAGAKAAASTKTSKPGAKAAASTKTSKPGTKAAASTKTSKPGTKAAVSTKTSKPGTAPLPPSRPATSTPSPTPPATPGPRVHADEAARLKLVAKLVNQPDMKHTSPAFKMGKLFPDYPAAAGAGGAAAAAAPAALTPPKVVWKSSRPPRKDHDCPSWLTATEFEDTKATAAVKVAKLAELLKASRRTVLYTGAGISASAIGQAALSGQNTVGWKKDLRGAPPTVTHHALARLNQLGYIDSWVQQNHDGLPQKAGYPQEKINEVHGSWYNPANPVVKYTGSLKDNEHDWMYSESRNADLVIVIGTSLGGLYADEVAELTASRARQGRSLGTVCINLQQTPMDGKMAIRMFGKSDDVLSNLLKKLGDATPLPTAPVTWLHVPDCVLVPYDANGNLLSSAEQPNTIHIGAKPGQKYRGKKMLRAPAAGTGVVEERSERTGQIKMRVSGANLNLGIWWLDAARRGALPTLPIINRVPSFAPGQAEVGSAGSRPSMQASAPPKAVASKAF